MLSQVHNSDAIKHRLLHAAGEEFALHGFEQATVRAICQRARVNLAAVNYHFGDKEQLYQSAVLEAHRNAIDQVPESAWSEGSAEQRLRTFVSHFLEGVLAIQARQSWQHDLMIREMLRPSEACMSVVESAIRPRYQRLRSIIAELAPAADERRVLALCFSVIGQCLFYKTARQVATRLVGHEAFDRLDRDYLTDHIAGVAIAAAAQDSRTEAPSKT